MQFKQVLLCFCALHFNYGCLSFSNDLNLELVQVIFRHGQRTAQESEVDLLKNANRSVYDKWGYGQLTNIGKLQEYKLGDMLRQKYDYFLSDSFRPSYVCAHSSQFDRTQASLQLVLAALFPPSDEYVWNENLKWMPIPIHSIPLKLDMFFYSFSCSKFQQIWKKLMNSTEMKNLLVKYEDIWQLLNEKYPNTNFELEHIFYLNNLLNIQKFLNISQPEWYTPKIALLFADAGKFFLETTCFNSDLIRLNSGLTKQMVKNFNINGTMPNEHKIYLYSGHDYNIYSFAKTHNITLEEAPPFGSAFILEKYVDNQSKIFVKMYMWTGESEELKTIKLNNCDEYCSIDNYISLVNNILPSDDEMRCLYKNLNSTELEILIPEVQNLK